MVGERDDTQNGRIASIRLNRTGRQCVSAPLILGPLASVEAFPGLGGGQMRPLLEQQQRGLTADP